MAQTFWMTLFSKGNEQIWTSAVTAKVLIQHPPPVLGALELEIWTGKAECCGLWWTCPLRGDPQLEDHSCYFRMENPFHDYQLNGDGQAICDHNKAEWSDLEDYLLWHSHMNISTTRRRRERDRAPLLVDILHYHSFVRSNHTLVALRAEAQSRRAKDTAFSSKKLMWSLQSVWD